LSAAFEVDFEVCSGVLGTLPAKNVPDAIMKVATQEVHIKGGQECPPHTGRAAYFTPVSSRMIWTSRSR
jgi:hypothetical protein